MSITAMKAALSALEPLASAKLVDGTYADKDCKITFSIIALRTAIAEAEKAKPVAKKKHEPTIDLGKYAGTYGGYTTPEPPDGYLSKAYCLAKELCDYLIVAPAPPVQPVPKQEPVVWDVEESVLAIHRIVKSAASFSTKEGALRSELKSVFQAGKAQPAQEQRKPLTDAEIDKMFEEAEIGIYINDNHKKRHMELYYFGVQDCEAAHGIGERE